MTAAPSASDGGDVGVGGGPMAVMEGAAVFGRWEQRPGGVDESSGGGGRRRSSSSGGDLTRSGVTQSLSQDDGKCIGRSGSGVKQSRRGGFFYALLAR